MNEINTCDGAGPCNPSVHHEVIDGKSWYIVICSLCTRSFDYSRTAVGAIDKWNGLIKIKPEYKPVFIKRRIRIRK